MPALRRTPHAAEPLRALHGLRVLRNTVGLDPSVVSRQRYRAALEAWDDPAAQGYQTWTTLAGVHYAPLRRLAEGDASVVYLAERARFPSERVLLKVLRDPADTPPSTPGRSGRRWATRPARPSAPPASTPWSCRAAADPPRGDRPPWDSETTATRPTPRSCAPAPACPSRRSSAGPSATR